MIKKKIVKKNINKPDFHITDRVLFVAMMLLVFSASATFAATKSVPKPAQTKSVPAAAPAPVAASCGGSAWSKVIVGTGNGSDVQEVGQAQLKFKKLTLSKSLSQANLEKLITDGCSFKVVEEMFESAGAYKKMSFECSFVNVANTAGLPYLFSCSPSQEEGHNTTWLHYGASGVYYHGNEDAQDIGADKVNFSLFTKN